MPDRNPVGILDTSVVIDLGLVSRDALPVRAAITTITMAELAAGPLATDDQSERAKRQDRLLRAEALFDPLPFDAAAARSFGLVVAAVRSAGRQARGRAMDLLIAAIAVSRALPLYTRNARDFAGLEEILEVVQVD